MSSTIIDKTILDMIEEGRNNFVSSRFDGAAKLFGSTVRSLEEKNYSIDAIYFSYARIVALNKAEKYEQEISALMDLGNKSKKLALTQAMEKQKQVSHPMEKSTFMNLSQKIMKDLGQTEERESMVLSLVKLYKSLISDESTTEKIKELFQDRIIDFCQEYDHPNLNEEKERKILAQLLSDIADELDNSEKLYVDVIAANNYIKAANIYQVYNMPKNMENMLYKALKCSKHGQFEKYGFVEIIRPPRAKDDAGKEINPDPDMAENIINEYMRQLMQPLGPDQSIQK